MNRQAHLPSSSQSPPIRLRTSTHRTSAHLSPPPLAISLALQIDIGSRGRGLFFPPSPQPIPLPPDADADRGAVFLRVPTRFCLSHSLPGALGAAPAHIPAYLAPALEDPGASWELKLALLLIHVARDPRCTWPLELRQLYADYDRSYLPAYEEQTSLLFFAEDELEILNDPALAETGRKWQARVAEYHARYLEALG